MAVRFNLNDQVRVKITDYGMEVRRKYYEAIGIEPPPLRPEWDGRVTMQLHEVMRMFGPGMIFGGDVPIETEVEFA